MKSEKILKNLETHLNEMRIRYNHRKKDYDNKIRKCKSQKEMREYYNWYHFYEGKSDLIDSILGNINRNDYDKPINEYELEIKSSYEN